MYFTTIEKKKVCYETKWNGSCRNIDCRAWDIRGPQQILISFLPSDHHTELYTTCSSMPTLGRLPSSLDICSEMLIGWSHMFFIKQSLYHWPIGESVWLHHAPFPLLLATSFTCFTMAIPRQHWVLQEEGKIHFDTKVKDFPQYLLTVSTKAVILKK